MTSTLAAPMSPMRTPPSGGPSSKVSRIAPWKRPLAWLIVSSFSPRSSGTITFWAVKYGIASMLQEEREDEQRPQRQVTGPVEDRDQQHQRRTESVRDQHRATSAHPLDEAPGRDPRNRRADERGHDHERHLARRAGGGEHEPRQREPGHLGACRRDHLGDEQRAQRAVPEDLGAAHARSSSRMRGIGEASRNTTPNRQPMTATQSVGRSPIAAPSTPPSSAPNGLVP